MRGNGLHIFTATTRRYQVKYKASESRQSSATGTARPAAGSTSRSTRPSSYVYKRLKRSSDCIKSRKVLQVSPWWMMAPG